MIVVSQSLEKSKYIFGTLWFDQSDGLQSGRINVKILIISA
ncbi:hypothetical protein D1AOALGA4SA_271 [Olavius algarvensis Delta 1 endosymbiont]|nr:hypothetical protein D1AOALGA4SA_271 [Olavius algarvensis Delta 1 endosymbiont]